MKNITFIILFMHIIGASKANAWGTLTHKSIAEIAQNEMTPATSEIVFRILNSDHGLPPVHDISDVAGWADGARATPDFKHTSGYHYEKIDDNGNFLQSIQDLSPEDRRKGSVVEALLQAERILSDVSIPDQDKAAALRFIIHFTGDVHQPLHTGRIADRGGNTVSVQWFNKKTNLHSIWDTELLYSGHPDVLNLDNPAANSPLLYAEYLQRNFSQLHDEALTVRDFDIWVQESMQERLEAYKPEYAKNQTAYLNKNLPWIDQRAYFAGVRLGKLLNDIFAHEVAPEHTALLKKVEAILGDLSRVIDFSAHVGQIPE